MEFTNLWMGFQLQIQLQCSRILCMPLQILQVCSNALLSMAAIENIYPIFKTLQPVSQFQSAWPNRCPKMPLRPDSSSHNQRTTCSYQREIFGTEYRFAGVLELVQGCKICPSLIVGTTWLVQRVQGPLLLITFPFGGRRINRHGYSIM